MTLEALKVLCNLLYNSAIVQKQIIKTPCLSNLIKRISNYNETVSNNIKLFDMRIMFLVTALNVSSRAIIKNELNGLEILTKILENVFNKLNDKLSTEAIELICEILKTLFNLCIESDDESTNEERNIHKNLVNILRQLLLLSQSIDNKDELQSHIINVLTVIPLNCYGPIIQPLNKLNEGEIYNNLDMSAICELLKFLGKELNNDKNLIESISPAVTALLKLCKSERLIRKYLRQKILPPLKDIMQRPEEGSTLKAKLCKLLTSPIIELRDLVAEFLFILCKENGK